jgi:uncharacterized membrane protein HdeD (DUF308 family)
MAQQWTERLGRAARPAGSAWVAAVPLTTDELRRARNWLTAAGALAIVAGIVAIAVPAIASVTTTLFVGWVLMFAGIAMGVHAFSRRSRGRVSLELLNAALAFLVGFLLVLFPHSGTLTLTFLLAVWFFATGTMLLLGATQLRGLPGVGWMALNGGLSILLGILIVADLPSSADWAIGLLVGLNLLFWGIRALFAAYLLDRTLKSAGPARTRPAAGL